MKYLITSISIFLLSLAIYSVFLQKAYVKVRIERQNLLRYSLQIITEWDEVFFHASLSQYDNLIDLLKDDFKNNSYVLGASIYKGKNIIKHSDWETYPKIYEICEPIKGSDLTACLSTRSTQFEPQFDPISRINLDDLIIWLLLFPLSLLVAFFINDLSFLHKEIQALVDGHDKPEIKPLLFFRNYFTRVFHASQERASEKANELILKTRLESAEWSARAISHDIRSPVKSLVVALKEAIKILRNEKISIDQEIDNVIMFSNTAGDYVLTCLDDLYTMGEFTAEEVGQIEMVSEIKKIFTVLRTVKVFLLKKTIFNLPEECFVMTSASMSRVIFNLMKNAAEATPVNGIIEINLVVINSKAVFSVTNEGEAISEVDMNRIWEPFYSKKAQGRGFGLKIVSKILNSQNITPYIESNNEKTTFLFEMELSRLS